MKKILFDNEKLWQIETSPLSFTTAYGKIDGKLKESTKSFDTEEKCAKEAEKLINKKIKSGYKELLFDFPKMSLESLCKLQHAQQSKSTSLRFYEDCTVDYVKEICKITSLEDLYLTTNGDIPDEIGQLKNLEKLTICGKHISKISAKIGQLKNLERLTLESIENISYLPNSIGNLTNLRRLRINKTTLTALPESIGQLQQLKVLDIHRNLQLRNFPTSIGQLTQLKELTISGTHHSDAPSPIVIPTEIGLLSNLEELELQSNNLSTLPESIGQLTALKELTLDYNAFTEIPKAIFKLTNLSELAFRSCKLTHVPLQICLLEQLVEFEYHSYDQTIKNIPEDILDAGIEPMQQYLIANTSADQVDTETQILLAKLQKSNTPNEQKEMPSVPSNKEILLEERKSKLELWEHAVNKQVYEKVTQNRFEELMLFIRGEIDLIPIAYKGDDYYFDKISDVLNPVKDWNFIDHRILAFITQDAFYFKKSSYFDGYYRIFAKYLKKEIETNTSPSNLYQEVATVLESYGLSNITLLTALFDKLRKLPLLTEDKKPTSLGLSLLDSFEKNSVSLIALVKEHNHESHFTQLMMRQNEKGLAPYVSQLTEINEYEGIDGNKHIPFSTYEALCAANPIYKKELLEVLPEIDCMPCIMEGYRILNAHCGQEYRAPTLEKTKEILVYISTQKNKKSNYSFSWSLKEEPWGTGTARFIAWACNQFGEDIQAEIFEYVENTKILDLNITEIAIKYFGQNAIDIAGEALSMTIEDNSIADHYKQAFTLLAALDYSKYFDKAWEISTSKFTAVADTACIALSQQEASIIVPKAKDFLSSKTTPIRRAGVLTLSLMNSKEAIRILSPLLSTEKNEDIRNSIVRMLMHTPKSISLAEAQERVATAKTRGKLNKPIVKWIDESKLPTLSWRNGTPLNKDEVRFLFYRQKSADSIDLDFEAREVFGLIDPKTSGEFARVVWSLLQKNGGAKAKNRFAMAVVGALADEKLIEPLYIESTTNTNLNTCMMLGLIKTLESARALDRIIQIFKLSYPNVRRVAENAFEVIANSMELSIFELSDKMLPDLGFQNLQREVQVGTNIYTAFITSDFKIAYRNPNNKIVKSLSKADKSVKDELKKLGLILRESIKEFSPNLEFYLVTQRAWVFQDWTRFFLNNPIAFASAQNFVWQTYDEQDTPIETFIVNSEQVFLNHQEQSITLDNTVSIRLVHPILMDSKVLTAWNNYMNQKKIKPPFKQLTRPIIAVAQNYLEKTMDYQYHNFKINGNHFRSRATKKGWKRGAVVDSGEISSYQKIYPSLNIQAILVTSNLNIQSYDDGDANLHEFYFVRLGSVKQGSYTYDEPRNESDERLIPFGQVPPIVYSEIISDLNSITNS